MNEIQTAHHMLSDAISRWLRASALASKIVKTIFITFFAAVAGVAQFLDFWPNAPDWHQVLGISATIAAALGGLYIAISERNAPELLEQARKALDTARDVEFAGELQSFEFNDLEEDLRRAVSLYLAMHSMRGALERIGSSFDENLVPSALCKAIESHLPRALGFRMQDQWTVGIYKAEITSSGRFELILKDQLRAIKCEPENARKWPEGVGFSGIAFTNRKEIIIDDAQHPTVASIFSLPPEMSRQHDADTYVSYAIVPILVGNDSVPWGVAVATSNVAGHFSLEDEPGVQSAEALRGLAGMVALGVAMTSFAKATTIAGAVKEKSHDE